MPPKRSKRKAEEDRDSRIRKLKKKVESITGQPIVSGRSHDLPPEVEEQFWENILEFEQAKPVSAFELLVNGGIALPQPDELDDAALSAKLREVINGMALLGIYLHSTDHLSDRELYEHLWKESLREDTFVQPDNPDFACHIDLVSSGSEEDIFLYLKYYADEEIRRIWAKDFPNDPIPEHADPRYDRDRHLPKHEYVRAATSGGGSRATAGRTSRRPPSKRPC